MATNDQLIVVKDAAAFRWRALHWALSEQNHEGGFVAFLNNNTITYPGDPFPNRLFVGAKRVVSVSADAKLFGITSGNPDFFRQLDDAHLQRPSWLVGYFGYDLKNQLEALTSRNSNRLGFPDAYFVEPEWVIDFNDEGFVVRSGGDAQELVRTVETRTDRQHPKNVGPIQCRVTPDEYQATVRRIQQLIRQGDVYELNYCLEFFTIAQLDPLATYRALNEQSPMPFSSFLKIGNRYVMSASPERFMKKEGQRLTSQPIKGTIRRGQMPDEDARLRAELLNSEKERAENLMIVDLVRNDLARSAQTGSVRVDELFGIYGFRQVYQMISTVSAILADGVTWADALRNAFPMGSMTGAPKIRAMQLIDELEVSRRGVYSGALGYVTPDADFDFSVVIRTLLYDALRQYASFSVGSAITYDADPAQEWEECLLKAQAIRTVLQE